MTYRKMHCNHKYNINKILCLPSLSQFCSVLQRDHMKIAQQFFQLVGGSASECGMSMVCPLNPVHTEVGQY